MFKLWLNGKIVLGARDLLFEFVKSDKFKRSPEIDMFIVNLIDFLYIKLRLRISYVEFTDELFTYLFTKVKGL